MPKEEYTDHEKLIQEIKLLKKENEHFVPNNDKKNRKNSLWVSIITTLPAVLLALLAFFTFKQEQKKLDLTNADNCLKYLKEYESLGEASLSSYKLILLSKIEECFPNKKD